MSPCHWRIYECVLVHVCNALVALESVISLDGKPKHMGVGAHTTVCMCDGLLPCNRWAGLSQRESWTPGSRISMCCWFHCNLMLRLCTPYLPFCQPGICLFDGFFYAWMELWCVCECAHACCIVMEALSWEIKVVLSKGQIWWFLLVHVISISFCCVWGGFGLRNLSWRLVVLDQRRVMFWCKG